MGLVAYVMLLLVIFGYFGEEFCFMPNRESAILDTDFTVEDIIRAGVSRALEEHVNIADADHNTDPDGGVTHGETYSKYYDDAVTDIINYASIATMEHHGDPVWTFSNEKILEGHRLLLALRDRLIATVRGTTSRDATDSRPVASDTEADNLLGKPDSDADRVVEGWKRASARVGRTLPVKGTKTAWRKMRPLNQQEPNNKAAREILGQIFVLISSFYSNTNWMELNYTNIYKQLGISNDGLIPVAPSFVNTCTTCGVNYSTTCQHNIITSHFLTSGYLKFDGNEEKHHSGTEGKCRHGGLSDTGYHPTAVPGGINKMSSSQKYSPHNFLHKDAAMFSIQHVHTYLADKEFGLRTVLGVEEFSGIFRPTDRLTPSVYVDMNDRVSGSEFEELLLNQNITSTVLDKDSMKSACLNLQNDEVIVVIRDVSSDIDVLSECDANQVRVIYLVHTGHTPATGERRKRAALTGLGAYNLIADVSGGTVYQTDKKNIAAVVDIIKESVAAKPPVSVLKFRVNSTRKDFNIPVDNQIFNLTIKIQSYSSTTSSNVHIYMPNGSEQQYGNTSVATKQQLGTRLQVIKIFNPKPGQWRMSRTSTEILDIDVGANTDLDFFYKFMQPGPGGFGLYPLIGRPIAGDNTTVQVSVPLVDKVRSVDVLLFVDRNNVVIKNVTLLNVGGRRGKALFMTHVTIPAGEFMIAIEGKDTAGNTFRRLNSKIVSSLAIQLEVFSTSGALYKSQTITIPYRVRNVGGGTTPIEVSISDDKKFARAPTKNSYIVASQKSANGTFTLRAGTVKGETTTVTISAKAVGAPNNKVQYYVRRFTVEEKIIRVIDVTPPTCNVTSTSGTCDFGSDVCLCSNYTWEMSAIVGDSGEGLSMVFAAGAGNNTNSTTDTFKPGHKPSDGVIHTTLRADCCHQHAKITAVDLAGNVGFCDVTITPGFIAPDPKICNPPDPKQSGNTHKLSCNTTSVMNTCNYTSAPACSDETWSFEAHIGNGSIGNVFAAPYNAGKNATLTKINNTIHLITDCCHPDVYVNLIDFASNTGQCHAYIPVTSSKNTSSLGSSTSPSTSSSTSSVYVIAGAAAGGVVTIMSITILILYLKSRIATNNVMPLNTKFKHKV